MTDQLIRLRTQERKRQNLPIVPTKKYPGKRAFHKGCFGLSAAQKRYVEQHPEYFETRRKKK